MRGYVRLAERQDCYALAKTMRKEDQEEVYAYMGITPLAALKMGYRQSDLPMTIMSNDGSVLAMFGVVPDRDNPRHGQVWMLASDHLVNHRSQFLRESRQWFGSLFNQYDLLYNYVDERNTVHIRWLQWVGVTFLSTIPDFGYEKRPFIEFVAIREF